MVEKLSQTLFHKIKIEHISGSTVWNFLQFAFIVCPRQGVPAYVEIKVFITCFYLI